VLDSLQNVFEYGKSIVRVVIKNGEPWFVARDVCECLGLLDVSMSVARLDEDEKGTSIICTPGGNQEMIVVSESGLYSLIMTSRKPEARQFKKWVTSEVLPQIRKTGMYVCSYKIPQTYPEALRLAADLAEQNQKLLPKAEQYDRFISGDNYQAMNIVAKALGIGRNKLFRLLRDRRILMNNNTPYQRYIDAGYFVVKEKPIQMGGDVINKPQTYVTAKGVDWLSRLLDERAS
jgi:prophage antirepressor-like protein